MLSLYIEKYALAPTTTHNPNTALHSNQVPYFSSMHHQADRERSKGRLKRLTRSA
jgi:hypothetical protein